MNLRSRPIVLNAPPLERRSAARIHGVLHLTIDELRWLEGTVELALTDGAGDARAYRSVLRKIQKQLARVYARRAGGG